MKKVSVSSLTNIISKFNYNRIIVSADLEKYGVFGLNERYEDESDYDYELIIDDRYHSYTNKKIKDELKDFLSNIQ